MSDINKVMLVGRLTRDCEVKQISNTSVCNFAIAVNRSVKQGDAWVDDPNFFDLELFGNLGPALQSYLVKGQQVAVEGALKQSRWETQDGQKRSRIVITVQNVQLVGGRPQQQGGAGGYQQQSPVQNGGQQSYNSGGGTSYPQQNAPQQNNNTNQQAGMGNQQNTQAANDFQDDIPF